MNSHMPRTPFSTPLSGSAKETEIRLKNIFSGPKKRPPALFLALMFFVCVFCGNLVSCQVKEAEISDIPTNLTVLSGILSGLPALPDPSLPEDQPGEWTPAGLENLSFSDGWHYGVNLDGLAVRSLEWSPSQRSLFFEDAAFLSPYLEEYSGQGSAARTGNGWDSLRVSWSLTDQPYGGFTVNLERGTVQRDGVTGELSDGELVEIARTLDYLMRAAEEYKKEVDSRPPEEGVMPFDRPMELYFLSGAGAWSTDLRIHPDGSFEGNYEDADMTVRYVCQFHGRFGEVTQVTGTSWSMTLEELVLDTKYPVGTQWDEPPYHYISSIPYGFDTPEDGALEPGARFMLYSPDAKGYAPTDDLYGMNGEDPSSQLYEFWSWWPNKHGWGPYGDTLDCWGLHSLASGYGFFSNM